MALQQTLLPECGEIEAMSPVTPLSEVERDIGEPRNVSGRHVLCKAQNVFMGEKNVTSGVLEAMAKCQSPVLCQSLYQMIFILVLYV